MTCRLSALKVFVMHKIELTSTEHIVCLQIICNLEIKLEIKLDSNLVGWNWNEHDQMDVWITVKEKKNAELRELLLLDAVSLITETVWIHRT